MKRLITVILVVFIAATLCVPAGATYDQFTGIFLSPRTLNSSPEIDLSKYNGSEKVIRYLPHPYKNATWYGKVLNNSTGFCQVLITKGIDQEDYNDYVMRCYLSGFCNNPVIMQYSLQYGSSAISTYMGTFKIGKSTYCITVSYKNTGIMAIGLSNIDYVNSLQSW